MVYTPLELLEVKSLQDILTILDEKVKTYVDINYKHDSKLFYRGQSDNKWQLCSSLLRNDYPIRCERRFENGKQVEILHDEQAMAGMFVFEREMIDVVLKNFPSEFKDLTPFQILSKVQHHGLPTRLLDISKNPLVASFFACAGEKESTSDGSISIFYGRPFRPNHPLVKMITEYTLHGAELYPTDIYEEHGFSTMPSFIVDPDYDHLRIKAQEGAFIWEMNKEETDKLVLGIKLIIPANRKDYIINQLGRVGIRYPTLFPDLDSMTKSVKEYYIRQLKETIEFQTISLKVNGLGGI